MESAIAFYHSVLMHAKAGEPALEYLRGRGFTDETIERFQLGWAPAGWDKMRPPARVEAPGDPRRAARGRARQAAPARRRRLRPVPRADDLPDPRRERAPDRARRSRPGQGRGGGGRPRSRPEVPELPGDPAVRQEPHALPHRPRQVGDPPDRPGRDRRGLHRCADGAPGRASTTSSRRWARRSRPARSRCSCATRSGSRSPTTSTPPARRPGPSGRPRSRSSSGSWRVTTPASRSTTSAWSGCPTASDPDEVIREEPDRWREDVRTAKPIVDHLIDVHARANDLRTPGGKSRFIDAVLPTSCGASRIRVMRDAYLGQVQQGRASRSGRCSRRCTGGPRATATAATAATGSPRTAVRRARTRCRSTTSCARSRRTEQELLRLVLLVPETARRRARRAGSGPAADAASPASCTGRSSSRGRRDEHGVRPPYSLSAILEGLDEESRALGQALVSRPGPNPRDARRPRRRLRDRAADARAGGRPSGRSAATTTATPPPRRSATPTASSWNG